MQLELIEKLEDENGVEIHVARLATQAGPRLVTARRLKRQTAAVAGLVERLEHSFSEVAGLHHPALLQPVGLFSAEGDIWWLSERSLGFDLATVFSRLSTREVRITPLRSLQIGMDFMAGLGAIHGAGQVYGGVTPRDVLVDLDGVARLDGIGFERALMETKELRKKLGRSRREVLAPEAAQGRKPEVPGDVFSAAALVYQLLTGQPPLGGQQGVSTRHQAVQAPSKLDRSLPYACDAVFVKALGTSPRQRHDSAGALGNALKSLRRSLVTGADEGLAGVADFVNNLYPNETKVAGMPGTLERPGKGDRLVLEPIAQADLPAPSAGATQKIPAQIFTPAEPDEPDVSTDVVSMQQLRSSSGGDLGFPEKAEPVEVPDLGFPEKAEPLEGPTTEATAVSPHPPAATADWDGPGEPTPAVAGMQAAGADDEPMDFGADTEVLPAAAVHDTDQLPAAKPRPRSGKGEATARSESAPRPAQAPPWRRPPFLVAAGLLLLAAIGLVVAFGDLFGGPKVGPTGPPSGQTAMAGYLSIDTGQPARVTLDGELLPGHTPLSKKVLGAGRHRLLVQAGAGQAIFDEEIQIQAGEHKELHLVAPADPAPAGQPGHDAVDAGVQAPTPDDATITAPPVTPESKPAVVKKRPKRRKKKRARARRRARKKRRRRSR